jgi:hypothetical protein
LLRGKVDRLRQRPLHGDLGVEDLGDGAVLLCALRVSADFEMRKPWPSFSRDTAASVESSVGVKPAPWSWNASAMVKQPACAAATSSSGFVPFSLSKRVLKE